MRRLRREIIKDEIVKNFYYYKGCTSLDGLCDRLPDLFSACYTTYRRHLIHLEEDGFIVRTGNTRNRKIIFNDEEIDERIANEQKKIFQTEEDVNSVLFSVDTYAVLDTFFEISNQLKGKLYWYALAYTYKNTDNRNKKILKKAFLSNEPEIDALMNENEKLIFNNLPEKFTIYTCMTSMSYENNIPEISWSLDKKFITDKVWYANQGNYKNYQKIIYNPLERNLGFEKEVEKKDVIALFNLKNENRNEIIHICI